MPVKLEIYANSDAFSEQDNIDIDKLYADHPQAQARSCVEHLLTDNHTQFCAARFNDRILGGLLFAQAPADNTAAISYLCVRKATRRRHVAHDLLREMVKSSLVDNTAKIIQTIAAPAAAAELMAFLMSEGFIKDGNNFSLSMTS